MKNKKTDKNTKKIAETAETAETAEKRAVCKQRKRGLIAFCLTQYLTFNLSLAIAAIHIPERPYANLLVEERTTPPWDLSDEEFNGSRDNEIMEMNKLSKDEASSGEVSHLSGAYILKERNIELKDLSATKPRRPKLGAQIPPNINEKFPPWPVTVDQKGTYQEVNKKVTDKVNESEQRNGFSIRPKQDLYQNLYKNNFNVGKTLLEIDPRNPPVEGNFIFNF
jgi:hypothetical protein